MSQPAKLLSYLESRKSITRKEAARIGIMNLWSRISDLESLGWRIARSWVEHNGSRFMRYTLVGSPKR